MRILRMLATIVQTVIFVVFGVALVLLYFNIFSPEQIMEAANYISANHDVRLVLGIIGIIFILGGLLMANITLGKMQMEKTIAFDNPEGQVTISLTAIEDFIKKSIRHLPEVKELRSDVTANKRGISIVCRATLFADSNIPDATEKIQNIVKAKVRDMLGVEEAINIKINVVKIVARGKDDTPSAPQHSTDYDEFSRRMPLGGF